MSMHNNYYFLRKLSQAIAQAIQGMELTACFSQNKNELILGFTNDNHSYYIKAHLQRDFCCLTFPDDFHRSRRNSVDLFKSAIHKRVLDTHQYDNERCFSIRLADGLTLLFKMHGNRSNVLLFQNDTLTERFNHQLKNDEKIVLSKLDRVIERSESELGEYNGNYQPLYPTFDKKIHDYLADQQYETLPVDQQWTLLQSVEKKLLDNQYYIIEKEHKLLFSLLETGQVIARYSDPILAVNDFFNRHIKTSSVLKEKREILSITESKVNRTKSYLKKAKNKLQLLTKSSNYSQWADILMANLHLVPAHIQEVTLEDFYHQGSPITIKLKPTLSPQKNAEIYYRKSKNQQIEINKLEEAINAKAEQLSLLETHHHHIAGIEDLKTLRNYLKEHHLTKAKQAINDAPKPHLSYTMNGFDIWVGKNAKNNDTLTQKLSYKEDLWLHAKDVSGSHVLIKYKSGQVFPKSVIEYAARLAAYYSKRKTDTLCPVIYTPKKFVRKLKGAPAGAVIVDKEQVILVPPIGKEELQHFSS
jgi:predicted ribosome quality control (RQC) complex YloA/Tae2 family protein